MHDRDSKHIANPKPRSIQSGEARLDSREAFDMLVERAAKGEKAALAALCEQIAKGVLYQVTHMMGSQTGVEDISQEVLIRVCENISSLRNPKAFRGWLARIIINEKNRYLTWHIKKGSITKDIEDHLDYIVETNVDFIPHEYADSLETHHILLDIVKELPMKQREAVMLHYFGELSVTEVADAMAVTTQTVSKNLAIAREKLRRELEDQSFMRQHYTYARN